MMSTEVYSHMQQMKITISGKDFILPYCGCGFGCVVEVSIRLW